jgi:hypothetical protein
MLKINSLCLVFQKQVKKAAVDSFVEINSSNSNLLQPKTNQIMTQLYWGINKTKYYSNDNK